MIFSDVTDDNRLSIRARKRTAVPPTRRDATRRAMSADDARRRKNVEIPRKLKEIGANLYQSAVAAGYILADSAHSVLGINLTPDVSGRLIDRHGRCARSERKDIPREA